MQLAADNGGLVNPIQVKYRADVLNIFTDIGLLAPKRLNKKDGKIVFALQPFGMKGERRFEDETQIFKLWEVRTKRIVFQGTIDASSFTIETFKRGPWELLLTKHVTQIVRDNGKTKENGEQQLRLKRRPTKVKDGNP